MTLVEPRPEQLPEAAAPAAPDGRIRTPRGVTTIMPEVIGRIAAHEAAQVPGVAEVVPGAGGVRRFFALASDPGAPTSAEAHLDGGGEASLDLTVHVRWPEPAMQVTEAVRDRVTERVLALTGIQLTEINVTVPKLVVGGRRPRPRVL